MTTTCDHVADQLSDLVDGDRTAIAMNAEHLAGCDACRDARHDAEQLAALVGDAGLDHVPPGDLLARVLAAVDRDPIPAMTTGTIHAPPAARNATILPAATLPGVAVDLAGDSAARSATVLPTATLPGVAVDPTGDPAARSAATLPTATLPGVAIDPTGDPAARSAATLPTATLPGVAVDPTHNLATARTAAVPAATLPGAATATSAPTATSGAAAPGPLAPGGVGGTAHEPAAKPVASGPHDASTDSPRTQRPARSADPTPIRRTRTRLWIAIGATAAVAAGGVGIALRSSSSASSSSASEPVIAAGQPAPIGTITRIERAAAGGPAGGSEGILVRAGATWRPLHQDESITTGAELRTDDRTRAQLTLGDGTRLVLDHGTALAFSRDDARQLRLTAGRLAADVVHITGRPAAITTPGGRIDVVGTRFSVTATDAMTSVQVTRGAVVLTSARGEHDDVRAGEEGVIEHGALAVSAAPGLVHDAAWSELGPAAATAPDEVASGLGALRAYKPGESRDRDWNLALARHDVKVRVVGPIARTEITETFRNDSAAALEGVYQFPLPADAQIDGLALDVAGGFVDGAFVDKARGAKIWRGVIDKATPKLAAHPSQEIIWVEGRWRDPALLDWKRGGRFELRVYPIPAHGARTIKLAYTQVVTPRGAWRQYSYPLPHSRDGSTVADQFSVDVELRGAEPGKVRTAGYDLTPDPARAAVHALTLHQAGFVPRGDLVIDYRATDGDAELRAWSFAGGAAAAPDDKLAAKQHVGIDPKVVEAQRVVAADLRPTAVLALHPRLPRWRDGKPRDYLIVVDDSQSMVGERFTRATELAAALVDQMDRRDRFDVAVCDSECRRMDAAGASNAPSSNGDLRTPSANAAAAARAWLAAQQPAGASDVVASLRAASTELGHAADREPWILYIGDGFASTGFRRAGDVEQAIALTSAGTPGAPSASAPRIATIGIGSDADTAVLQAAARGGGGSYLAWVPGQRVATAAAAVLESTLGAALRDAVVELPAGLDDVAPTVLPTVRAGDEVLLAARMTGAVSGDVIVRGTVAGQPFEQRYPVQLAVSSAPGNGFVPRLWAQLAIDQLERAGTAADRAKIVALSQGFGVMSRETSLLVLESQAMFDAFGVDRGKPAATWTGEDALDEVTTAGTIALNGGRAATRSAGGDLDAVASAAGNAAAPARVATKADEADKVAPAKRPMSPPAAPAPHDAKKAKAASGRAEWSDPGTGWIQLRRIWTRVPSVSPYDTVPPSITKAIGDAEAALAASPDSREKHRALVQALSYAGELDRARDVAQRWLDRDALDPQALGYLADLLGRGGHRELALRTLAGLVDLDPDRVALHERMVRAYEQVGRLAQACGHRIALATLQPTLPAASAGALRCLRTLGRAQDAELILRAFPDDASRAAVEKAALVTPLAAPVTGDLVVKARWDGAADLDVTLVTPEGARVSWMGGRPDVVTADVTSSDHEALAVKLLRRGNYLVEISRAAAPAGTAPAVHGTLDITALGTRRSIPFELTAARAVVGRVSVRLEESFQELDGSDVQLYNGPDRRIVPDRGPAGPFAPRK